MVETNQLCSSILLLIFSSLYLFLLSYYTTHFMRIILFLLYELTDTCKGITHSYTHTHTSTGMCALPNSALTKAYDNVPFKLCASFL